MPRTLSPAARIERSILSDFRKPLWRPFVRGIKQYKMIAPGDHIAVCISGGKDSMLLAKMMQLLQRPQGQIVEGSIRLNLGDGKAMNYAMDAAAGEWQLTDYVKKGIELLDNPKGFFLMTESGKIDWACHANDAAASIHDVLEMSNAVQAAVEFQNKHPNETLILVTADHETGGMAIGYKTTNYDTFLTNLAHQKMSYAKFDSTYVQNYIANKTPFEVAMQDVKANFGLTLPTDPDAANAGKLLLTDYEVQNLRTAYERTLKVGSASQKEMSQQDYELYGTYIPFSMAICHTINHKSGMDHTTYAHTGAMVNVYANGVGAEKFGGVFDNTEIFHKLADLTKVK